MEKRSFVFEPKTIVPENHNMYNSPPIIDGYIHIKRNEDTGFVIQRICGFNQFVWVPVETLDNDGTLDGTTFDQKFGRRRFSGDRWLEERGYQTYVKDCYIEPYVGELVAQCESVKKYGGFYVSRYNISKRIGMPPESGEREYPLININYLDAMKFASEVETGRNVTSHLLYGAEYDTVLAWFLKSNARDEYDILRNSSAWGNFDSTQEDSHKLYKTGKKRQWYTNNIADFAGNVSEMTQELYNDNHRINRGGSYMCSGEEYPVAGILDTLREHDSRKDTGFRVALTIR